MLALGTFFNILESKAKQTLGKRVIVVDPKNASQMCSYCGEMVPKALADRIHKCPYCGLE
jgi:putative transposase